MKRPIVNFLKPDWILGFVLLVVTLFAYQPAWNGKPVWDDEKHMTRPGLRSMDGLAAIWTHPGVTQQYYPLTHTVFWLEYHCWGGSPPGYHLLNIFLHVLSAFLLVRILRFLQVPGAWLIAAIFALHPLQVESVAWMTELKNTLSGVFFLSTALVYLKFDRERKRRWYAIAIGLFVLGLLSKSVIATLPVSLLVVFWWKRGRMHLKQDVAPLLPFFVLGIASGLFTAWVERKFIGAEGGEFSFTIIERGLVAGRAIWFYLGKLCWPVDLAFIYPRWSVNQAVWRQYLFPIAALLLAGALWTLRNRSRAPLAAFLCFTTTIFPVLGFFNVFPFRYSFVADHFQYLACIGPVALAAAGIARAIGPATGRIRFLTWAGALALLTALGLLTWRQSGMYADAETLYMATIRKNPACWMAHNNLGLLLANAGRTDEAMVHYLNALEINPAYAKAHNNLALLLAETGRTEEAEAHYQKALEINPNSAEVHANLGNLLTITGRADDAIAQYRKALEINPNYAKAHYNLGNRLMEAGRIDEAMAHYLRSLEINPDNSNALKNLAAAFVQKGQPAEAVSLLQRALALAKSAGDGPQAREIAGRLEKLSEENRSSQEKQR